MTITDQKECLLPTRLLIGITAISLSIIVVAGITGMATSILSPKVISLVLVFGLISSLVLFKNISILRCPSKVLVSGLAFVALSAFLDSTVF